uniref:F-box domain-containing protein n=1 Tax=Leersia perrieri TaxID=77586 RepID=A0A0D9XX22_9ORYZ
MAIDVCSDAIAADGGSSSAVFAGGVGETAMEDIPADVLSLVLRRLDAASLAALACSCSAFRDLAADDDELWRCLCLATWPSLRDAAVQHISDGYRRLFADAFPFPAESSPAPAAVSLPVKLISAVDLHHDGVLLMSRVVETDTSSEQFSPSFRLDALVQEGFTAPSLITPANLTLSWILIDPDTGRAVNASSRCPVSVERSWLNGDTVARFTVVLAAAGGDGCVALDAAVTCDERHGHVREVSLRAEDGGGIGWRDGIAAVVAAMDGARHRGGGAGEEAARRRYEAFARGRTVRKERKAMRDGVVDVFFSCVAAAAFVGILSMLSIR